MNKAGVLTNVKTCIISCKLNQNIIQFVTLLGISTHKYTRLLGYNVIHSMTRYPDDVRARLMKALM